MTAGSAGDVGRVDRVGDVDRVGRLAPVPMLAVSVLLAAVSDVAGYVDATRTHAAYAVAAGALAWEAGALLRSGRRLSGAVVTVLWVGRFVLSAALVALNPWFGIYAFTGYLLAEALPRPFTRPACVLGACVVAASQAVGYPFGRDAAGWLVYLVIAAVNSGLVLSFLEVNQRLERRTTERETMIRELNESNAALHTALAENAGLHAQLVEQAREAGVLDERHRLAGEIHDTLAQDFVGIVTQLEAAERAGDDPERWRRHLTQARALARSGVSEARRSVRALRPEQLEQADLVDALSACVSSWSSRSGAVADFAVTGCASRLPGDVEDAMFRVAQEALTNVERHASAGRVGVTLTFLDDVVVLDVRDDGRGWDGARRDGGFGLDGMRARLSRVGGRLEIETAPGEGTALSATVPVGTT